MVTSLLFLLALAVPLVLTAAAYLWLPGMWALIALLLVAVPVVLAVYDVLQRRHTILHNFPVIGHMRYLIERIGPEMRQYIVADDKQELPFNRSERAWVYASSKAENNYSGFGTAEQIYGIGYPIIKNATIPFPEERAIHPGGDRTAIPCHRVIGQDRGRRRAWRPASLVNISAMSFGSLGWRAVTALNRGARIAGAFHNTGEGGVSPYHGEGADVVWQLGTGYFGARESDGRFSLAACRDRVEAMPQIRMIEIKLSQGAKPGKGGVLPAAKVTPQIARIRGVPVGEDCMSPNAHREFNDADGLIDFVERIADATGLPVGVKAAIGETEFWTTLARRMRERGAGPDFITIDGGEGGTGAAPLTFADHVSLPFKLGFARVYRVFQEAGMSRQVTWIGSAKLGFPDRALVAIAMGCDLINVAREAMLALGCIQAQKCHTDHCPTGIATHSRWLQAGLDIDHKAERVARYLRTFRVELLALAHAAGREHPCQIRGDDIEMSVGTNKFATVAEVFGYRRDDPEFPGMAALQR